MSEHGSLYISSMPSTFKVKWMRFLLVYWY